MTFLEGLQQIFTRKRRYLAVCEFWIFVTDPTPVDLSLACTRLTRSGEITPQEAMLAGDIRLFFSTLRKAQNPHIFRPDLFSENIEPSAEILQALGESDTIAKIRYLSEEPLNNDFHLGFMPRLAVEIAKQRKGVVIFDSIGEELVTVSQLQARNESAEDRYGASQHLRTVWLHTEHGGFAATRGLMKVGVPELQTPDTRPDHRAIVCEVLDSAAVELWNHREVPESIEVNCYDDTFVVKIQPNSRGSNQARVARVTEE
jgi:hypothetical protein